MLVRVEGAQSGGAVYRRVVLRNIFCTAGIVISYAISTLVVVFALLHESSENNKVRLADRTFWRPTLNTFHHSILLVDTLAV